MTGDHIDFDRIIAPTYYPEPPARQAPAGVRFRTSSPRENTHFIPWSRVFSVSLMTIPGWGGAEKYHFIELKLNGDPGEPNPTLFGSKDLTEVDQMYGHILQQIADGVAIIEVP